nr:immunoglobulin heavy chain junction region [Mus musculus]
ISVQDIVTTT